MGKKILIFFFKQNEDRTSLREQWHIHKTKQRLTTIVIAHSNYSNSKCELHIQTIFSLFHWNINHTKVLRKVRKSTQYRTLDGVKLFTTLSMGFQPSKTPSRQGTINKLSSEFIFVWCIDRPLYLHKGDYSVTCLCIVELSGQTSGR